GAGIFYSATHLEAQSCREEEIAIVGGGNSAGQAAVFLSGSASGVNVVVRGPDLAKSMSRYLIQRIENSRNVDLRTRTRIDSLEGGDRLERIRWRHVETGEPETRPIRSLFVMTGADPNTAWLRGCVVLDEKNFVKTGADLRPEELTEARWPLARRPFLMETSIPGMFAVGDVRSSSVKRVIPIVDLKTGEVSVRSSDTSTLDVPFDLDRGRGVASLLKSHAHYFSTTGKSAITATFARPLSLRVRGEECLVANLSEAMTERCSFTLSAVEPRQD